MTQPLTTRDEQRKAIWNACQFVLGWAGIIAICGLVYWAVGRPLVAAAKPGENAIVFLYAKNAQNAVFWCVLVGGLFFFLLLAAAKTTRGLVIVCVVFLAAAGLGGWSLWGRVSAMAFHENVVELRFVWPRPAVRLKADEIISVEYEESVGSSDDVLLEYTLHLRTRRGHYVSFADASLDDVRKAIRRIEEMRGEAAGQSGAAAR